MLTINNPYRFSTVGPIAKVKVCKHKNFLTTQSVLGGTNQPCEVGQIRTTTHKVTWGCNSSSQSSQSKVIKAWSATTASLSSNCQRLAVSVRMCREAETPAANVSCQHVQTSMLISLQSVKQRLESILLRTRGTIWARTKSSTSLTWLTEKEPRILRRCKTTWPKSTWCKSIIRMEWAIYKPAQIPSSSKKQSRSVLTESGAPCLQMQWTTEMRLCRQWCKVRKISINRINRCNNKWTTTLVRMRRTCSLS